MVRIGSYTLDQRANKIENWLKKKRAREMVRIGIYTLDQRAHKIEKWLRKKRARNEVIIRQVRKKRKQQVKEKTELQVHVHPGRLVYILYNIYLRVYFSYTCI